jgi:hypothetical protein
MSAADTTLQKIFPADPEDEPQIQLTESGLRT